MSDVVGRRNRSVAVIAAVETLELRRLLSVGGGFTGAGIRGEYFANPALTGSPAFTRRDVRIDFDWGTTVKPGGSISPGFRDVPADNYSVRWTGKVVSRFSETYTFKTISDDAVRLMIRPEGSATWTTLVDAFVLGASVTSRTGTYALTAGQKYEIRMEYAEGTGSATAKLRWSSPSTPEETIDPLVETGINNPDWSAGYTDILRGARNSWEGVDGNPRPAMDASGWPMGNGSYVFQESLNQGLGVDPLMRGTVTFSFTGRAVVSQFGNMTGLTSTYNAANNTTTGSFRVVDNNINASTISFRSTDRDGNYGADNLPDNDGITNLKLMRPTAPDATTSYPQTNAPVFTPQMVNAMSKFTVVRHQYVANQQRDWSERTPPTYFNQNGGTVSQPKYGVGQASENGASWEHKIMLANESGSDLMISLPVPASGESPADTQSYVYKLAQLLRYGSDANGNPYSAPTADPAYPPLNPNLRVYLELGNELWNFASVFYTDWQNLNEMTEVDLNANNANWQALNYDNLALTQNGNGDYNNMPTWRLRKALQRTMQISDIFRSVWGDSALPGTSDEPKVRPIYEWQYANLNNTASIPLVWAEKYYNNGEGISRVANPKPISHYLYGGGGATYYGAVNGNGLTNLNPNPGFDLTTVGNGYTQNPAGTGYTFTGTAGIARDAGTGDDIPSAFSGAQMAYLSGPGSEISFDITFPTDFTSNVFAVAFKAHNRWTGSQADEQNLRVLVDGVDITARTFSQGNGVTAPVMEIAGLPPGTNSIPAWQARNVFWTNSQYYYTKTFTVTPGQTRRITIRGMGDITSPQPGRVHTAFVEDLRVTSVDRIFEDGMPGGGDATGQPAGTQIRQSMITQANWANAYGLRYVAYEGGWSLGGDDGGSPLQLEAKYRDARTAGIQGTFMDWFHEAGGEVNVHGTYAQWPSWADFFAEQGLLNVGQYPIIQGMENRSDQLKPEPINGVTGPVIIKPSQATLANAANTTTGVVNARGGWLNWNFIAPVTGMYQIDLSTTGSSTAGLLVNGEIVTTGATGSPLTATVFFTKGQHTIRALNLAGTSFTATQVTVSVPSAPAAPSLTTATDGNGTASLAWTAVPGATGYAVRFGTSPNNYTQRVDVASATAHTLTGLTNNQRYYIAISAYNASGDSLPSNERSVLPLADGQVAGIVTWDFSGYLGSEATAPATNASGRLTVSPLSRGSGIRPNTNTSAVNNTFSSWTNSGQAWATTLADALTRGQFNTFTVSANPGQTFSLQSIAYNAYWQNATSGTLRATGVSWSTDGGATFSPGIVATGGPATGSGTPYTVNLAGIPSLQGVGGSVIFRIAVYGNTDANNNPNAGGAPFEWNGIGGSGTDITVTGSVAGTAPQTAPAGLSAVAQTATRVVLAWTDTTADETHFTIQRATNNTFTQGLTTFTASANTTTYTDNTPLANTTYFYRIFATNAAGNSPASNTAQVATPQLPPAPLGLSASSTVFNRVSLAWTTVDPAATSVVIERSVAGGAFTPLVTLPGSARSYLDTPTSGNTLYAYRLLAVSPAGTSAPSSAVSVTTPQGPTPLAADDFSSTPAGPLLGTTGGTGWAAPWTNRDNNPAHFTVATSPLMSYPGVDTGSKVVQFTGTSASAGRTISPAAFQGSTFDRNGNLRGGETIWFSALLRLDRSTTSSVFVGLGNNNPAWFPTPSLQIGKINASGWQIRLGKTTVSLPKGPAVGETNLIAVKLDWSSNLVSVYLNPTAPGELSPANPVSPPTATFPLGGFNFRSVVYFGGTQSGDSSLGAVRFGKRYLDVAPPATASLARPGTQEARPPRGTVQRPGTPSLATVPQPISTPFSDEPIGSATAALFSEEATLR